MFGFDGAQNLDTTHLFQLDLTPYAKGETQETFAEKLSTLTGGTIMKFDCIVGNPPYQEESAGQSTRDEPVYHYFYDLAEDFSGEYCLVSPGRFLFNAGSTPRDWNTKMLQDLHTKVLHYDQNSENFFQGMDIKGGVAIVYRNTKKQIGPIGIFTNYEELSSIAKKVRNKPKFESFADIITNRGSYRYSDSAYKDKPDVLARTSDPRIASNAFDNLSELFYDKDPNDGYEYVQILGRQNNNRVIKWILRAYVKEPSNFSKWKVVFPKSNGSGAIGEVLSTPLIGEPLIGYIETFISAGEFDSQAEAENCMKYIKTKFARCMLGVLKITQDNTADKWKYVPLQDFTQNSDIDWSKSVHDIDQQLYAKYGLDEHEVEFIESKVKAME